MRKILGLAVAGLLVACGGAQAGSTDATPSAAGSDAMADAAVITAAAGAPAVVALMAGSAGEAPQPSAGAAAVDETPGTAAGGTAGAPGAAGAPAAGGSSGAAAGGSGAGSAGSSGAPVIVNEPGSVAWWDDTAAAHASILTPPPADLPSQCLRIGPLINGQVACGATAVTCWFDMYGVPTQPDAAYECTCYQGWPTFHCRQRDANSIGNWIPAL